MVFLFKAFHTPPPENKDAVEVGVAELPPPIQFTVFMGKDKYENEDLIKWSLPTDVWFHVDDLSSAHVYLRLPDGFTVGTVPADVLQQMCQLVKANSIEGSKRKSVKIVYTMASNLKKTNGMEVGQVSFHKPSECFYTQVDKDTAMIKAIVKTKVEKPTDVMQKSNEAYYAKLKRERKAQMKREEETRKQMARERAAQKEAMSYDNVFSEDNMVTNQQVAAAFASPEDYEDDFM